MNNSPPFDLKLHDETTTPGEAACLLTDAKRIRPSMTSVVSAECNANGPYRPSGQSWLSPPRLLQRRWPGNLLPTLEEATLRWLHYKLRLKALMADSNETKKFLFIGDSDSDAARSRIAIAGVPYVKKRLESGPENWSKIIEIIDSKNLIGVLVKLTNNTMARMLQPKYAEVQAELLSRICQLPHIAFVHSSFFGLPLELSKAAEEDEDYLFGISRFFRPLEDEERKAVMELFSQHDLNVVAYRRNVELSVLAGEFVEGHQSNLMFRFYVPTGKIYADQTADVVALFHDYLTRSLRA